MYVWRLNRTVLALFCVILLVFLLVTFSLTQNDRHITLKDYSRRQNVLENTKTEIGNPHAIREVEQTTKSISSTTTCKPKTSTDEVLDVAAVVCGDRLEEAMNMVKSILIFTSHRVHFHLVAEQELQAQAKKIFESFPSRERQHFGFTIYNLSYPPGEDMATWKKLFKTCASQRLFLMDFIKRDKILYLDTDTLVLSPLQQLWHHFGKFNRTQLAAMTTEGEVPALNWYHRFARHPFYGELGLNSGVMLMDLRKLREFDFTRKIIAIYREYKYHIVWGDQDLLNIFFHKHPELVYVYPCEWNYRPDHCMYRNNCQSVLHNGVYVLHGNRGVFHNEKRETFKAVYNVIRDFKFGRSIETDIVAKVLKVEDQVSDRYCQLMVKTFVKNMLPPNG